MAKWNLLLLALFTLYTPHFIPLDWHPASLGAIRIPQIQPLLEMYELINYEDFFYKGASWK
jgi:hypothetical protein